jgi:lincosamide nucleotidyltransferase B/F
MDKKTLLLARLEDIGRSLQACPGALALIGLGSVGLELERLDEFSDLDFFVIVEEGRKAAFIERLDWLSGVCPVAYAFRNTVDGYKLLFEDGVFCEFAVFEQAELERIPFSPGRVVWKQPGVADEIAQPVIPAPAPSTQPEEWLVGEALTNLYVGLGRFRRGEKLSAARFIQGYAVDRLVELAVRVEPEQPAYRDPFTGERRFEQRFPGLAGSLVEFIQGYDSSRECALAILGFLERHFAVNPAMAGAIRKLCEDSDFRSL